MPEARSKAHYRMVWGEEVNTLNRLNWATSPEDKEKLTKIQEELRGIIQRCSVGLDSGKKPDICPDCGTEDYFCAYRKNCPEDVTKD